MNFKEKSYLTLTKQAGGLLGSEIYVSPEGLAAYDELLQDKAYYPAKDDAENWEACAQDIENFVPRNVPVMEYGTGVTQTVQKTGKVIQALDSVEYAGVDTSRESIEQALAAITALNQEISVIGIEQDFWDEDFPVSKSPTLAIFAGGSVGNFEIREQETPPVAQLGEALKTLSARTNGGWLLISADTLQASRSSEYYESAYSGPAHAAFNLSIFRRMNKELGLNISPDDFYYRPVFNRASGAVQHMAYSRRDQKIDFEGKIISIKKNEGFLIQNSFRFAEKTMENGVAMAGLLICKIWKHPRSTMYLYLLRTKDAGVATPSITRKTVNHPKHEAERTPMLKVG